MISVSSLLNFSATRLKQTVAGKRFRNQAATFAGATLLLTALAGVDRLSGPYVHLGPLYLLPVALAAWFGGRWPGYGVGLGTILAWMLISKANVGTPADRHAELLNLLLRLVYYPAVIELVVTKRGMQRRLEKLVGVRTLELQEQVRERERAEAALRELAAQLSAAEDAQRRQLAHDIHDSLSQMLGVVKMNLQVAVADASAADPNRERLIELVGICNDLIHRTREFTFDLHPPLLDDLGLVPALRGYAQEMLRRSKSEFTINEVGERRDIPLPLASYLFRAVKELMHNALKHGGAREVVVAVHWLSGSVRVVVDDDGSGFDPAALQGRRGLGLAGIRQRMASLGGRLKLDAQPGQGTRAILEAPLPPSRDVDASRTPAAAPAAPVAADAMPNWVGAQAELGMVAR
jgi:signal transduction histidine kinase